MSLSGSVSGARIASLLLAAWLLATAACSRPGGPAGADPEATLAAGWAAYLEGRFADARAAFAAVSAARPESTDALYGLALTSATLHEYDRAVATYERALATAPDDGRLWEGYVYALTWGGVLQGDRRLLETALRAGAEALTAAADRPYLYDHLETAARELHQPDRHLKLLEELEPRLRHHPVFRIELYDARLQRAGRRDDDGVETLKAELRRSLEALGDEPRAGPGAESERLYILAAGHLRLGEADEAAAPLRRLERTAGGRALAEPLWWRQFVGEFVAAGDDEGKLEVIADWKDRFVPTRQTPGSGYRRAILGLELRSLVSSLREFAEAVPAGGPPQPDGASGPAGTRGTAGAPEAPAARRRGVDRLLAAVDELTRIDTWGTAATYGQAASLLVEVGTRLEDAVRLCEEGIAALEERRPGILYPGDTPAETEEARLANLAALNRIRGQALAGLGRVAAAEAGLRKAVGLWPSGPNHGALGEFLLERQRPREAYESLVEALAHGFTEHEKSAEAWSRPRTSSWRTPRATSGACPTSGARSSCSTTGRPGAGRAGPSSPTTRPWWRSTAHTTTSSSWPSPPTRTARR